MAKGDAFRIYEKRKKRIMAHHNLKLIPKYYEVAEKGIKTFELRKNDRNFKEGDTVTLEEFNPENKYYTGRKFHVVITFILTSYQFEGIEEGFVIFSFKRPYELKKHNVKICHECEGTGTGRSGKKDGCEPCGGEGIINKINKPKNKQK